MSRIRGKIPTQSDVKFQNQRVNRQSHYQRKNPTQNIRENGPASRGIIYNVMTNDEVKNLYNSQEFTDKMNEELMKTLNTNKLLAEDVNQLKRIQEETLMNSKIRLPILDINNLRNEYLIIGFKAMSKKMSDRGKRDMLKIRRERMTQESSTEAIDEDIKYTTTRAANTTYANDLTHFPIFKYSDLRDYNKQRHILVVQSLYRDHALYPNLNYFTYNLFNVTTDESILGQISNCPHIRSILYFKLINAIIPNYLNVSTSVDDTSFIVLKIPEIESGEIRSQRNTHTKSFCVLKPKTYFKTPGRTHLTMDPDDAIKRWPVTKTLPSLRTLTIQLLTNTGDPYVFRPDYFDLSVGSVSSIGVDPLPSPSVYDLTFTTLIPHSMTTNDTITFFNVKSRSLWYIPPLITPTDVVYSDYKLNPIINRPSGYNVTVINSITFSIRVYMDDKMKYDVRPTVAHELFKLNDTIDGYMVINENQLTFTFEIEWAA